MRSPYHRLPTLVGRTGELARLVALLDGPGLDGPGTGSARTVELVGDPGIGKTRLLMELAAVAERAGHLVLWGRAAEFQQQVPFGMVTDALEDHLDTADPETLGRLPAEDVRILRTVFPRLPGSDTDAAPLKLIEAERYRLHRAVRALLEALAAGRGLVLILDDLHWADGGSAELVDHLLRHPPRGPVLVAVAHRPRQIGGRLRHALGRAVQDGSAELIEVSPLSRDDAEALLPPGWGAARRNEVCLAGEGNPFYLQALAGGGGAYPGGPATGAGLDETVPAPVRAALAGELSALTAGELLVAQAAAVVGDVAQADLIARTAGLDLPDVLAALDGLARRDLLRPDGAGGCFRFRHPLVRTATYRAAAPGWRIAAHGRAAAALRERGGSAVEQARHVEHSAGPGDARAAGVLQEAAAAVVHSAPATAAHWLQAALRLLPDDDTAMLQRLDMLGMRARALGVIGRLHDSRDAMHELLALVPAAFAEPRAQITAFAAAIERLIGRPVEARAMLLAELATLDDEHGPAASALKAGLATGVLLRTDVDDRTNWPAEALRTARLNADRAQLAGALAMSAMADHITATVGERTVAWLDEAAALVDALPDGELTPALEVIGWLGAAEMNQERFHDAGRHMTRALQVARVNGQAHVVSYLHGLRGSAHAQLGDLAAAAGCFADELEAALLTDSDWSTSLALQHLCWIATWRGDLGEALRLGKDAVARADSALSGHAGAARGPLGLACLYSGDPATARDLLLMGGGPELLLAEPATRPTWYETLAAAEAALGDLEQADRWADRAHACAAGLPWHTGLARLARVHALLPTDPAGAVGYAEGAADLLTRAGTPVDAGRAHLLAGVALAATGDTDRSRERFAQARSLFTACGAGLLLSRTVREERRMNARRPRRTGRAPEPAAGSAAGPALTAREAQVAELVGQGLTNREIAEKLFLSPKTVDVHLGRIYAKLGVSRRAAVAARLAPPPT